MLPEKPACRFHSPASSLKRASSITGTPSCVAFCSLEPAASPATRYEVFLLTDSVTLPPCALTYSLAPSRLSVGKVPVITKVSPSSGPSCAGAARRAVSYTHLRAHETRHDLV